MTLHRYDHPTPAVADAIRPRQPKRAVSPRVHAPVDPGPIDGRRVVRTIRLAVGTVICWAIGHRWRRLVWVNAIWVPEARTHVSVYDTQRRRGCGRCEIEQTRVVGGKWRKQS